MAGFNHFGAIGSQLYTATAFVVSKTAFDLEAAMKDKIRANGQVDTGNMMNSVHTEDGEDDHTKRVVVGAPYGFWQNYGTSRIPARPFFEPSIELVRPGFEAALSAIESTFG